MDGLVGTENGTVVCGEKAGGGGGVKRWSTLCSRCNSVERCSWRYGGSHRSHPLRLQVIIQAVPARPELQDLSAELAELVGHESHGVSPWQRRWPPGH